MGRPVRITGRSRRRGISSGGVLPLGNAQGVNESEIQKSLLARLRRTPAGVKVEGIDEPLTVEDFTYSVPNGIYIPGNPVLAARIMQRMKAEGLKVGVHDIVIVLRTRLGHPGAYLELKRAKGSRTSEEQKRWRAIVQSQGYFSAILKGPQEVEECVCNLYGPAVSLWPT